MKVAPSVAILNKPAPCLPFPFGQIIGQPGRHIGKLLAQVTLELENDRAEQCVGAAVDFGQPYLVVDLMISDAETVAQDIGDVAASIARITALYQGFLYQGFLASWQNI